MLSLGTELFLALWMASYRVGLPARAPPPVRAATTTFLISLAKSLPRLASTTAFLCLVVAHLEWLLMWFPSRCQQKAHGSAERRSAPDGTTWPGANPAGPRRSYRRARRCRGSRPHRPPARPTARGGTPPAAGAPPSSSA